MEIQREKARGASAFGGFEAEGDFSGGLGVRFVGYDALEADSVILEIRSTDEAQGRKEEARDGEEVLVVTETTPSTASLAARWGTRGSSSQKEAQLT
jgi:hypothetical protein